MEECWLVLAKKQEVEQYSDPVGGAYRKVECIRGGDTLISTVGAIGRVAYFHEERGCIAQNVNALRPKGDVLAPEFLYYYLASSDTQTRLANLNIGVAQPSLKVPHLLARALQMVATVKPKDQILAELALDRSDVEAITGAAGFFDDPHPEDDLGEPLILKFSSAV